MISNGYFEIYKEMLKGADSCSRRLAYDELLHFYKQNESVYNQIIASKQEDWQNKQHSLIERMDKIKNLLQL